MAVSDVVGAAAIGTRGASGDYRKESRTSLMAAFLRLIARILQPIDFGATAAACSRILSCIPPTGAFA